MKVLILGGDGMLGHQLLADLSDEFLVKVTIKDDVEATPFKHLFNQSNAYFGVNALDDYSLLKVILEYQPDVIINALGVIKYRAKSADKVYSIKVNSLLPHRLADFTRQLGIRVINFSTDCVFSGKKGFYTEDDVPDSLDIYGLSKAAGEIRDEKHCLTLRTSFFGLEIKNYTGLIEWFVRETGQIKGFTKAIYSGISTLEMAKVVKHILKSQPKLHGLYHVATSPIDKFNLLDMLNQKISTKKLEIIADDSFVVDRSLDSSRFVKVTQYKMPSWEQMLSELANVINQRGLANEF